VEQRRRNILTVLLVVAFACFGGLSLWRHQQPRVETVVVSAPAHPHVPAQQLVPQPVETTPTLLEPQLDPAPERVGLAAFDPPGTRPLKQGLVVPDDYELPPGYVRHYQNTDNGQRLQPILMYAPGFNAPGILVPPDRIVPAEDAPKGMPVEMLELPK
jgi:hypothetical protein